MRTTDLRSVNGRRKTRRVLALALIMLFLGLFTQQSAALTWVHLTANPFVDPSYDLYTSTSGVVEYRATLASGFDPFNKLDLDFFSSPIFDLSGLSLASMTSPDGSWGASWVGGHLRLTSSGTAITEGQALTFRINYKLYNPAVGGPLGWSSTSAWSQNYNAYSSIDGSSTAGSAGLAPEPGTLLLLGSGLLGTGLAVKTKRRKNRSSEASKT